jgi:hypothetical protein
MDEKGRKTLIGIIIAIIGGVSLYFLIFDVSASPSNVVVDSARPAGDGITSPEASAVTRAMVGVWRSADDPKFTREFRGDGTVTDRYEGDEGATKEGIWGAFTADMAVAGLTTGLTPGTVYVQVTIDDSSLYFSVIRAADTLELLYLDRGEQLNFTRSQ